MIIEILEKNNIKYIIKKGKFKRISLKYNNLGYLQINYPNNVSFSVIEECINKNINWILNNQPVKPLPHNEYQDYDQYLFLGKLYTLRIVYSKHEEVIMNNNTIIVYTKDDHNISKNLDIFRYNQAEIVFNEMLYKCFKIMEKDLPKYPKLIIKKSKTRWGCCYIKKNEIMLNISLIHTPLYLIEFVICHELNHFKYPNHSKEFHNNLKKYIDNEKARQKQLNSYNIIYK